MDQGTKKKKRNGTEHGGKKNTTLELDKEIEVRLKARSYKCVISYIERSPRPSMTQISVSVLTKSADV